MCRSHIGLAVFCKTTVPISYGAYYQNSPVVIYKFLVTIEIALLLFVDGIWERTVTSTKLAVCLCVTSFYNNSLLAYSFHLNPSHFLSILTAHIRIPLLHC